MVVRPRVEARVAKTVEKAKQRGRDAVMLQTSKMKVGKKGVTYPVCKLCGAHCAAHIWHKQCKGKPRKVTAPFLLWLTRAAKTADLNEICAKLETCSAGSAELKRLVAANKGMQWLLKDRKTKVARE